MNNEKIELIPKVLTREEDIPSVEAFKSQIGNLFANSEASEDEIRDYMFSATRQLNDSIASAFSLIGGRKAISNIVEVEDGNGNIFQEEQGLLGVHSLWLWDSLVIDVAARAANFYEDAMLEMALLDQEGSNEGTSKNIQGKIWTNIREQFVPTLKSRLNATGIYNFVFKNVLPYAARLNFVSFGTLVDAKVKITTESFIIAGNEYLFSNQKEFNEAVASVIEDIASGAVNTQITSVANEATEMLNPIINASQRQVNEQNVIAHGEKQEAIEFNAAKNVVQDADIQNNANDILVNAGNINAVTTILVNSNKSFLATMTAQNIGAGTEVPLQIVESKNTYPYLTFTAPNQFVWNDTVDGLDLNDQSLDISANFDGSGAGSTVQFIVRDSSNNIVYDADEIIQDGGALILLDQVNLINGETYTCFVSSSSSVRLTGGKFGLVGNTAGGGGASLSSEIFDDHKVAGKENLGMNEWMNEKDTEIAGKVESTFTGLNGMTTINYDSLGNLNFVNDTGEITYFQVDTGRWVFNDGANIQKYLVEEDIENFVQLDNGGDLIISQAPEELRVSVKSDLGNKFFMIRELNGVFAIFGSGIEVTDDRHLTNKAYVDAQVGNIGAKKIKGVK